MEQVDNLVTFLKSGIGMRVLASYWSATAYATFKDVALQMTQVYRMQEHFLITTFHTAIAQLSTFSFRCNTDFISRIVG
jgi:hypothetical protein